MLGPKSSQPHIRTRTRTRRTDAADAGVCWRIWLVCAGLLLSGVRGVAGPANQPGPGSGGTSPPGARAAAAPGEAPRWPRIAPDYLDVVIPPNLAPLNLVIQEPGTEYQLRVSGARGQPLELRQAHPRCASLRASGRSSSEPTGAAPCAGTSPSAIRRARGSPTPPLKPGLPGGDRPLLVYRRFRPLYSSYKHLGIYQRNLERSRRSRCCAMTPSNTGA